MAGRYTIFLALIIMVMRAYPGAGLISETIVPQKITESEVWTVSGSPYIVKSGLTVRSGARLTIRAGVEVALNRGAGLTIEGELSVEGEKGAPIKFSANRTNPGGPYWGNISLEPISGSNRIVLRHCIIEYSGKNDRGAIYSSAEARPELSDIILRNNKYNGVELPSGPLTRSLTLSAPIIPYFTTGNIEIPSGLSMTVAPGVNLKFPPAGMLKVYGALIAEGKTDSIITFTSIMDDDCGGMDTDGGGYSSGSSGDWGGVYFSGSGGDAASKLTRLHIRCGGGSSDSRSSLICFDGASPKIEACKFSNSAYYGVMNLDGSSPDFGGGAHSSSGLNVFEGFSGGKYAFVNKSREDVYAVNNCWDEAASDEDVAKVIIDGEDKDGYGIVHYSPFNTSCGPTPPMQPLLILPENDAKGLSNSIAFSWEPLLNAEEYILQISEEREFISAFVDKEGLSGTSAEAGGLAPGKKYYWRVLARNSIGDSPWSEIREFTTQDTVKPGRPELLSPADGARDLPSEICFAWTELASAESYELQIAGDAAFSALLYESAGMVDIEICLSVFHEQEEYHWRVRAVNGNGAGEWSEGRLFATGVFQANELPANWKYESKTGVNSTILIRSDVAQLAGRPLERGDAIGVFYSRGGAPECGGYSFWDGEENIVVTAWGDNLQTTDVKDGFDYGEQFMFKLWDSQNGAAAPVSVEYESGLCYFIPDTLSVIKSFHSLDSMAITLREGFNLASGYVAPFNSSLEGILPESVSYAENSDGETYAPGGLLNSLGYWNMPEGYKIYSESACSFLLVGDKIEPASIALRLKARKWRIVPFFFNKPAPPDIMLKSLQEGLLLAKNAAGEIFFPRYGFNEIEIIKPGEAIKLILTEPGVLSYPDYDANASYTPAAVQSQINREYRNALEGTGNNAALAIESDDFSDGDEIGVFDESRKLLGAGAAIDGMAFVTVWGDNVLTESVKEGVEAGDKLFIRAYTKISGEDYPLWPIKVTDLIDGGALTGYLEYETDAILLIKAVKDNGSSVFGGIHAPEDLDLSIMPNPFNDGATLHYRLERAGRVTATIYDNLGRAALTVVDGRRAGGSYSVGIEGGTLPPGVYYCRLQQGWRYALIKMIKIK